MILTSTPATLQTDVYSAEENYSAGLSSFLSALSFGKLVYYVSDNMEEASETEPDFGTSQIAFTE